MRTPGLAAITLHQTGGGVAAVARLVQRVVQDEWGGCAVYELGPTGGHSPRLVSLARRLHFGARIGAAQAFGRCDWMFYSHLAVARVQRFIPAQVRRPYAVFLHGIEVWRPLTPVERALLNDAALVVTTSRHTARQAREFNPELPPVAVCPLGVSEPQRMPYHAHVGRAATILTVARLAASERYKGHDQLIDALPAVCARVPEARLLFVGEGDDVARLQARAFERGVGDRVVFTGFLSQAALKEAYRDAAVFAMPSRGEGFGLAYLEAMEAGLPCLGSIHDAAGEIIEDGATGYLVDQGNVDEITQRLVSLLADPHQRLEMGRRGRLRWEQTFTYERFRHRFRALLSSTLHAHGLAEPRSSSAF